MRTYATKVRSPAPRAPAVQPRRACAAVRRILRAAKSTSDATVPEAFEQRFAALRCGGQPLPASERAFFEPRFGRDLADVRLHSGPAAGALARSVDARAFTLGSSIVLGDGQYSRELLAHELTHVAQQNHDTIHRAQIGRVTTGTPGGTDFFTYELDSAISTFSGLASRYGTTTSAIASLNPGVRATALHIGDQIKVPAVGTPASGTVPTASRVASTMMSTRTANIDLRWSATTGANKIGGLRRGAAVSAASGGVVVPRTSVQNQAAGIVDELALRGLANATSVFGFVPAANLRATAAAMTTTELDLIARMIWGEQRSEGVDAMVAAAWIVKNRYNAGWGTIAQIITPTQFHGIADSTAVVGLTGADATRWAEAQTIATEVMNGTRADNTAGAVYFGNGSSVLSRMQACRRSNPAFTVGTISGTNFHFSNGDYTSGCTIPP